MATPNVPWDGPETTSPQPVEETDTLRADLARVREEEQQVEQRKIELVKGIRERIHTLHQLLVDFGAEPEVPIQTLREDPVLPAARMDLPARPVVHRAQTPIIEYVRKELQAVGQPIETSTLRQTLMVKYHVPATRLKNLSQILYKATSVVKDGGKVGLAEWKRGMFPSRGAVMPAKRPARKPVAKPAAKEQAHANQ